MVERHVQTVKNIIKKAYFDKKDPYLALIELNNTPITSDIPSPNKILIGHNVRGVMPDMLVQQNMHRSRIKQEVKKRQLNQKCFHDRRAKDLPEFKEEQNVRVSNNKGTWDRVVVVQKEGSRRAYKVKTEFGSSFARNRIHLARDAKDPSSFKTDIHYDDSNNDNEASDRINVSNPSVGSKVVEPPTQILPTNDTRVTRSGRVSRKPGYLSDYICS